MRRRASRTLAGRVGLVLLVGLSLATLAAVARLTRPAGPDRLGWSTDVSAARRSAAGKAVLLDFTADWCPACQQMLRDTWSDPAVAADVSAKCVAVRVDADAQPALARQFGVEYLPTLVLITPDGRELRRSTGFLSPDEFRQWLAGRG